MVFQDDTVLPWLTVLDNVGLHFRFTHGFFWKRNKELVDSAMRLLKMTGLQDYADAYPEQLSGGMRRRVAVLTAVASLPDFLLMDEPFSALDEPTRIEVHDGAYKIVREFGVSTVLVTHDLAEAISLSDRVLLLSKSPARIVSSYQIPFPIGRDVHQLREQSEFLDLYGRIWGDLDEQIRSA
jgi:ABC-type nitrate/sulfonate/bicarbonate transport system ATPase subunit